MGHGAEGKVGGAQREASEQTPDFGGSVPPPVPSLASGGGGAGAVARPRGQEEGQAAWNLGGWPY